MPKNTQLKSVANRERAVDVIEPPSVSLNITASVRPTWTDYAEPDAYITNLEADIMVANEDFSHKKKVGTVSALSARLEKAAEDGVDCVEVLDARSADTALYLDLFDVRQSRYSGWVDRTLQPFGRDLLILDRIQVLPEFRGNGYGLYAAYAMISNFAPSDGLVACIPAPFELLQKHRASGNPALVRGNEDIPGWNAALAKLRRHWGLLGFRRVPRSDVFALSLTLKQRSIRTVMQAYWSRMAEKEASHSLQPGSTN